MSHPTSGTTVTAPVNVGGLELRAVISEEYRNILNPEACRFVVRLAETFEDRRQALLAARAIRQEEIRNGKLPDFLEQTRDVRSADWTVAPIRPDHGRSTARPAPGPAPWPGPGGSRRA